MPTWSKLGCARAVNSTTLLRSLAERAAIERREIADPFQRDIGGRIARQRRFIARVMALPHEHRRHPPRQLAFTAERMRSLSSIST